MRLAFVALISFVAAITAERPSQAQTTRLTRADAAEVYLDLERALRAHPAGDAAPEINRKFDEATLKFFTGQRMIRPMRDLADQLRFGNEVTPNHAFASSLRASVRPLVMSLEKPQPIIVSVEPMYEVQPVGAVKIRIQAPSGKIVSESSTTEPRAEFTVEPKKFGVGAYRVQIMSGEEARFTTRFVVTERSLDATREELLKELDKVNQPAPVQALAACRARAELLTDSPSQDASAQFLADPIALRDELEREVASIKSGKDPYENRRGDYWRVFAFHGVDVPARVLAPSRGGEGPFPLVIALHGAGGDENMWPDGYGAGELKGLVEKHGFIAISLKTELLIGNAALFDSIVNTATDLYRIDRDRVYLIGHSLGAMASTSIASQRPEAVTAICLFSGMGRFPPGKMPPALVISGDLDPLMRPQQVESGVAAAREAHQPVELRMIKGRGHTLLVGEEMPRAIEWLLKHKK